VHTASAHHNCRRRKIGKALQCVFIRSVHIERIPIDTRKYTRRTAQTRRQCACQLHAARSNQSRSQTQAH
jgi:hypothetical protein